MNRQALFTLSDIETAKYGAPLGEDANFARGADKQPRKKRGLGRTVVMGAAGAAGLGVAGRYGVAAARSLGRGRNLNKALGATGKRRIGALRSGFAGIKGAAKRDVGMVRSGLGRARTAVARTGYRAMGRKPNQVG